MLPLLKQRILSFLCRRAMSTGLARRKLYFHLASGMFSKLAMWRCMFLDRSRLLLKFGAEEQVTGRTDPPPGSQAFFVLYNLETTLVEGVWDSASEELLVLYERCHAFRGPQFVEEPWHPAQGVVENPWAREAASKGMHAVGKAKNGGVLASIRRLLSALPHNPQSHSTSAYLDLSLFSYTHPLSTFERPILLPDHPLRFWNRATGEKVFELDLGQGRRWGSLVWHPVEPLCFSVVVGNGGTTVNLHVR